MNRKDDVHSQQLYIDINLFLLIYILWSLGIDLLWDILTLVTLKKWEQIILFFVEYTLFIWEEKNAIQTKEKRYIKVTK
jgi:hypothetical protein